LNEDPRFAHASEAELARILDYYKVAWQYEPHVFPIRWNSEGVVVESFAPDFYLPELGLHIELTTLKQSLVRKKNRKLRHLRELYPMVRIKLFYARDFRALMLKYGRLDAAASLIGIDGQPPPKRGGAAPAEGRPGDAAGGLAPVGSSSGDSGSAGD
jgi:hypoxanthine phosphoribosyltransferase